MNSRVSVDRAPGEALSLEWLVSRSLSGDEATRVLLAARLPSRRGEDLAEALRRAPRQTASLASTPWLGGVCPSEDVLGEGTGAACSTDGRAGS